ncbi:hypothetical protein B0H15DRAFT_847594 [Mycena belliarum]|uniref:Uncharacterized protein n=1 Tax=Mycena belliarum TaxID=1033014 RepID=A0AAD6XMG5_9AGAR|nr:hypothetical protein B0H15DRAFT_847594 [Mycena belliae]
MHIISTINAKIQSVDDVPVVLVSLEGKRKFLPRPETYKEMQRLVRMHYEVDPLAVLQLHVSTWDVCGGENVEVTEAAYALLAPFLESVSIIVSTRYDRSMPTPSTTPSLRGGDETDDGLSVRERMEREKNPPRAPESQSRPVAAHRPKVESEDEEEVLVQSRYRQAPKKEFQVKQEPRALAPKEHDTSQAKSSRSVDTAEASTTSDADTHFHVLVSGPGERCQEREFKTRGGHRVSKVLAGVCKTFKLDPDRAKLMLCVPMVDEGEETVAYIECANDETMSRSGVKPGSRLVVRPDDDEEEEEEEENYDEDD